MRGETDLSLSSLVRTSWSRVPSWFIALTAAQLVCGHRSNSYLQIKIAWTARYHFANGSFATTTTTKFLFAQSFETVMLPAIVLNLVVFVHAVDMPLYSMVGDTEYSTRSVQISINMTWTKYRYEPCKKPWRQKDISSKGGKYGPLAETNVFSWTQTTPGGSLTEPVGVQFYGSTSPTLRRVSLVSAKVNSVLIGLRQLGTL